MKKRTIFLDYWICDQCQNPHYGMCHKCGMCGRIFNEIGMLLNGDEYPSSDEED
jgi:hypothetical protein